MRRPVFRRTTQGMALFPFLAVLICTMGALIVLLVMILQQARVHAATASQQQAETDRQAAAAASLRAAELLDAQREQQAELLAKRESLAKLREQQLAKLATSRLELSHLEDHLRRLEDQAKQMTLQINELERTDESTAENRAAALTELKELRTAIDRAKQEIDSTKKKSNGPRSFAIIPYQGPNGTRRRPIYIECAEEGIVLHPEQVALQPGDFNGPLGPGNPLAACLNATREYLLKYGDPGDGEPYPLLIVRPNGAIAYAMARAAMKSWEDEFGYELIDGDMKLKFPPADPALESLLMRTIKDARSRQEILAAQMPSRYKDEQLGFVATGNRGFVATGAGEADLIMGDSGRKESLGFGGGRGKGVSDGSRNTSRRDSDNSASNTQPPPTASNSRPGPTANGATGGPAPDIASATGGTAPIRVDSLARTKGADWALPNKSPHSTGITRPIRIQCHTDRLVIVPERGDSRRPKVIPVTGSLRTPTEACVSEIWKQMEDWGLAVAGGYWKPVLKVEVGPGAEKQFAEFETLLRGSGLEVQRSSPASGASPSHHSKHTQPQQLG